MAISRMCSATRVKPVKKRNPERKARRGVVGPSQGGFNRFGKLLLRSDKLEHTVLARNLLAAAITTLRKVMPNKQIFVFLC